MNDILTVSDYKGATTVLFAFDKKANTFITEEAFIQTVLKGWILVEEPEKVAEETEEDAAEEEEEKVPLHKCLYPKCQEPISSEESYTCSDHSFSQRSKYSLKVTQSSQFPRQEGKTDFVLRIVGPLPSAPHEVECTEHHFCRQTLSDSLHSDAIQHQILAHKVYMYWDGLGEDWLSMFTHLDVVRRAKDIAADEVSLGEGIMCNLYEVAARWDLLDLAELCTRVFIYRGSGSGLERMFLLDSEYKYKRRSLLY